MHAWILFLTPQVGTLVEPASGYRLPPPEIVAVLDAAPTPDVDLSPDARWMLLLERPAMPSIADVTRPWVGLAGIRVDPALRAPQTSTFVTRIRLRSLDGATSKELTLPADTRVIDVAWAPTSDRFAFTTAGDEGVSLWTAEVGDMRAVARARHLNSVLGRAYTWLPGGTELIVRIVPEERRGPPSRTSEAPTGPNVQETSGKSSPLRTYQDLLRSPDDERLFEHYATSRLTRVSTQGAAAEPVGHAGLIAAVDASPDGEHFLVTRLRRPFSYVLPAADFPETTEVWSRAGKLEHVVVEAGLGDDIPMEGVRVGPRNVRWQPNVPATLVWCEALDGGDPRKKAEKRDRWMRLAAPFAGAPAEMFKTEHRAQGLSWFDSPDLALVGEYDRERRWVRTQVVDVEHGSAVRHVVDDRSMNDRYGDPGAFASRTRPSGARVLRQDGDALYRVGAGASKEGARPFLDRFHFDTGKAERLWQCASDEYESVVAIAASAPGKKPTIVTSRESPTMPPNYWLRDLEQGTCVALTDFPDPQPAMRKVEMKLVKYERKDGVALSATLYQPKDRPAGTRLPLFVWAYPNEFTDAGTAGQVAGSPQRFVRVRGPSQILFALHGWAVMDNASMPVVGPPETVNDTFLQQIVMNAEAAIAEADRLGVADPARVAVGGHSYGSFMTANLLAHCDLFKAGVARSGAYNRTLTPFGFQSERRTIWEAPKSYLELSPFLVAHKLNEPILFIHGEKDDNPGTFPIQSERMYQAVKGNGGTARLVVLPGEAHGYRARESVLHTVAEMFDWCDRFVRDAAPAARAKPVEAGSAR